MKCLFKHSWGWPRKRGGKDMQVCLNCGCERVSKVSFDGPRYHRTQDAMPNVATPAYSIDAASRRPELVVVSSAAA